MISLFKKCLNQSHQIIWLQRKIYCKYIKSNLLTDLLLSHYLKTTRTLYPSAIRYSFQPFSTSVLHHKEINKDEILRFFITQFSSDKEALIKSKVLHYSIMNVIENSINQVVSLEEDITELESFQKEDGEAELKKLVDEDLKKLSDKITSLKEEIYDILLDSQTISDIDELYLEISSGAGGQEAMLFVQNLLDMYERYCISNGWSSEIASCESTPLGGIRHVCMLIRGNHSYTKLKFEGGIHRVQRIPKTEKSGRIHTSTVSVTVLPVPPEISINIQDKDLKIETMRASGPGGQNVNKSNSAVRVYHLPSGLVVECQLGRSQEKNKEEALRKLRAKLYEIETDKQHSQVSSQKKLQMGTKARSEKIRTYNFPQDRVTDHRIGLSLFNIDDIIGGGATLEKLISQLVQVGKHEKLTDLCSRNFT